MRKLRGSLVRAPVQKSSEMAEDWNLWVSGRSSCWKHKGLDPRTLVDYQYVCMLDDCLARALGFRQRLRGNPSLGAK